LKTSLNLIPIGTSYRSILPKHEIPGTLPGKMKAWVTYRGGKTVLEQVPLPRILPHDVLIEPLWISICASDVNKFIDLPGNMDRTIFGHEFAGKVVACGEKANKTLLGQTVVVEEHYPCLRCSACLEGNFDACREEGFLGWYSSGNPEDFLRNGAFADYVSIHHYCAKPTNGIEKLDFFPSLAEPFGNAVKMGMMIVQKCGGVPQTVVIWGGCGAQALYMVPYLLEMGVKNFVLIYRGKSSMLYMRDFVKDFDADFYFVHTDDENQLARLKNLLGQKKGFVGLELTGHEEVQEKAIKYSSPGGKIFYYGLPSGGEKVYIPGTEIDIHSFITGETGIEEINLGGVRGIRVMGRDSQSWAKSIKVLKESPSIRKAIMKPLVFAGISACTGELVDYLMDYGVRYNESPYGERPAKFALISEKMFQP